MNPEVKIDFLAALRSGKAQATGVLCEIKKGVECFCASGLLAELALAAGVIVEKTLIDDSFPMLPFYQYDGHGARLPATVMEWAGIDFIAANKIIRMNDNGKTFEEIADWVEVNL